MPSRRARERGGAAAPVRRFVDFWRRMRRERPENPSPGAGRPVGGRAGPGSPESGRRCEPPCGCEGVWVRRGRVLGAGRGAGARRDSGAGAVSAGPPGVIYWLSRPRAGSWACSSFSGSLALRSCHCSAGTAQGNPREGEPASQGGRDQGGGNEGAPRLSLGRVARPSCCHRSAPSPDHTWETWDNVGAACGTSEDGPGL